MSLATLIASNAAAALGVIKQYTTNPKVGGVLVQATRFDCIMDAEVSRHVLINLQQGLQNVMDNVAPGPRTWEIEGYVGGLPGELTSLYMPSLSLMVKFLDMQFNMRQMTFLIDPQFRTYNVFIASFRYSYEPSTQNRVPVKLSLVEVTILKADIGSQATVPTDQANASAQPGQPFGASANLGSTAANANVGPLP